MTKVIFRKWHDGDDLIGDGVIALFPEIPASGRTWDLMDSYEHVGQHGAAHYATVCESSDLATPEEYADLLRELESIGYEDLEIRHRETPQARQTRLETWQRWMETDNE